MFTVDEILEIHYPEFRHNFKLYPAVRPFLKWLLHEKKFQVFDKTYPHVRGIDFIETALEYFNFSYIVSDRERENIPSCGRVVIVSNHPIGSLDGLSLLKLVHDIRPDVKIVANEMLMAIKPLTKHMLPVRNMSGNTSKQHIKDIIGSLKRDEAVIFFPAGEVSRLSLTGIRDCKWNSGFMKFAEITNSPVLPVYTTGRNSVLFYTVSSIFKPFSTAMLIREMFAQRNRQIRFRIGEIIPHTSYSCRDLSIDTKSDLVRKHIYRLRKRHAPLFKTQKAIALPERRSDVKKALESYECMGKTPDNKLIYLCDFDDSSPVLREIGRLREVAFRAVDEGTGKRRDNDLYDLYYRHLVLWDSDDLEITGAYRFVDTEKVISERGVQGLYTGNLFSFSSEKLWFLENSLELGRSFVQPRYWGRRSLDYLWFGIGAYFAKYPHYRYMFGPVSITNAMPSLAKELLIYFYKLYFGADDNNVSPKHPFRFSNPVSSLEGEFCGNDYRTDFGKLKTLLSNMGVAVPTLYKQYSELCKPGGVKFLEFNVDPDFNNCVDGLVIVDLEMLKEKKRTRYMGEIK